MYELFLVISFIVILMIKKLKMAQSLNFMTLTLLYFLNEMNMLIETYEFKIISLLSIMITGIILMMNIQQDNVV